MRNWKGLRAQGSALKLRVREEGTVEPSAWGLEDTNTEITAGSLGLYAYEPNTADYHFFSASYRSGRVPPDSEASCDGTG